MGKVGPEFDRDGEDQAGLNQRIEWAEEIGECQAGYGVRERRHGSLHSVACKINPFQKVSDLVAADAEGNLEHFRIRDFLAHGCVQTRSALLDLSEVEGGYACDRLKVVVATKDGAQFAVVIRIGSANGRNSSESNRVRKIGAEVRIGGAA